MVENIRSFHHSIHLAHQILVFHESLCGGLAGWHGWHLSPTACLTALESTLKLLVLQLQLLILFLEFLKILKEQHLALFLLPDILLQIASLLSFLGCLPVSGLIDQGHSFLLESLVLLVKASYFIGDAAAILDTGFESLDIALEALDFL